MLGLLCVRSTFSWRSSTPITALCPKRRVSTTPTSPLHTPESTNTDCVISLNTRLLVVLVKSVLTSTDAVHTSSTK